MPRNTSTCPTMAFIKDTRGLASERASRRRIESNTVIRRGVGFLYSSLPAPRSAASISLSTLAVSVSSRPAARVPKPGRQGTWPPASSRAAPCGRVQIECGSCVGDFYTG